MRGPGEYSGSWKVDSRGRHVHLGNEWMPKNITKHRPVQMTPRTMERSVERLYGATRSPARRGAGGAARAEDAPVYCEHRGASPGPGEYSGSWRMDARGRHVQTGRPKQGRGFDQDAPRDFAYQHMVAGTPECQQRHLNARGSPPRRRGSAPGRHSLTAPHCHPAPVAPAGYDGLRSSEPVQNRVRPRWSPIDSVTPAPGGVIGRSQRSFSYARPTAGHASKTTRPVTSSFDFLNGARPTKNVKYQQAILHHQMQQDKRVHRDPPRLMRRAHSAPAGRTGSSALLPAPTGDDPSPLPPHPEPGRRSKGQNTPKAPFTSPRPSLGKVVSSAQYSNPSGAASSKRGRSTGRTSTATAGTRGSGSPQPPRPPAFGGESRRPDLSKQDSRNPGPGQYSGTFRMDRFGKSTNIAERTGCAKVPRASSAPASARARPRRRVVM